MAKERNLGWLYITIGLVLGGIGIALGSGAEDTLEKQSKEHEITTHMLEDASTKFDVSYGDTLIRYLTERHEKADEKTIDAFQDVITKQYAPELLDLLTEEELNAQVKAAVLNEQAYLRVAGTSMADLNQAVEDGANIYTVIHAIVLDTENTEQVRDTLASKLQGEKTVEELTAVYEEYQENGQADIMLNYYTENMMLDGFQPIFEKEIGGTEVFGDAQFASVMRLQAKELATVDTLKQLYTSQVVQNYPSAADFAKDYLATLDVPYTLSAETLLALQETTPAYQEFMETVNAITQQEGQTSSTRVGD